MPFPNFLFNFGNIGSNSDFWSSTGCEGRNLRIASGSFGACALRDDRATAASAWEFRRSNGTM
ncbi:MAG TPA: hypothetical protein VJN20_05475 [Burkholderiales bacterium]|nr:hypothetical protein [Burkholderiales bacterium]